MSFGYRRTGLLGATLLGVGAIAPWAHTQGLAGDAVVSGARAGTASLLACAGACGLLIGYRRRRAAALCAAASTAWTLLLMYELPGTLTVGPVWRADLAWGAFVALLGAVIMTAAAFVSREP